MSVHGPAIAQRRPLVPSAVLAMAIFIAAEAMFFAGLISAFLVLRAQGTDWPPLGQPRLPVIVTGVNTLILLLSGWTMIRAGASQKRGEAIFTRWLDATAFLGIAFLLIQGYEWLRLVGFGLTTSSSLYGATFYTLVGAHGLHVVVAVAALIAALRIAARPGEQRAGRAWLEPYGMYWLFVVAVWPVLYVLVYLT